MIYKKVMHLGKYQPSLEISALSVNKSLRISGSLHVEKS